MRNVFPVTILSSLIIMTVLVSPSVGAEQLLDRFQLTHAEGGLSLHKEMFMLPATLSDEYNGKQTEAVFQVSAKHRLFGSRFYFAYTQISFWQAYDNYNSAPFRETNYNPEIFYRVNPYEFTKGELGSDIGFEHQSNGQRVPESRSWNLIYVTPYYCNSHVLVYLKLRYRIPEDDKESPEASSGDDNPDITDYLGYSDLDIFYKFPRSHTVHLRVRGNLNTGLGGFILNYNFPVPKSERSFFILRLSNGYGESLVDYNKSLTRFGVGIMFGY